MKLLVLGFLKKFLWLVKLRVRVFPRGMIVHPRMRRGLVSEYQAMIIEGLGRRLNRGNRLLFLDFMSDTFFSPKQCKLILVNLEHTLVLPGGRGSGRAPVGSIQSIREDGESYLVRLQGHDRVIYNSRAIVDYSQSNIENVLNSPVDFLYRDKSIYISPAMGEKKLVVNGASARDVGAAYVIMNLGGINDRRHEILNVFTNQTGVPVVNLTNLANSSDSRLNRAGILINLHQTEHHHTLEELRILPAMLNGMLVISEPSPLLDHVSYSDLIYFAEPQDLGSTFLAIRSNFRIEWEARYGGGKLDELKRELNSHNDAGFNRLLDILRDERQGGC